MAYFIRFILFAFVSCQLAGCFILNKGNSLLNLDVEAVNWQQQQKGCTSEDVSLKECPTFIFNGLSFKHEPLLNDLIEKRLLALINAHDASLWDLQHDYLARANKGDQLTLSVIALEQSSKFIVLELLAVETHSTDIYSPIKMSFINFDKHTKQDVQLAEAIEPDKILTFWSTAEIVYKQWLEFNQLLNNKVYQEDWPFLKTKHMALLPNGLVLKYDANTLAPYAMGNPTLVIPYNKLEGIVKPRYVPH